MSTPSTIVKDTHLQVVNNGLKQIEVGLAEIALAERAGIDVADAKQRLLDNKQKLLQFKNTYFPNQ